MRVPGEDHHGFFQAGLASPSRRGETSKQSARLARRVDGGRGVDVIDSGSGFGLEDRPAERVPRVGLQTMRERAEGVGGRRTIEPAIGSGTRISVFLPAISR